ncbi:MAG: hypothetical protein KGH98_01160 [Candidatus Micrarchaeota archaeon]|nr:hypothetical protein [Candidatus Micrarchaeota archaeon]
MPSEKKMGAPSGERFATGIEGMDEMLNGGIPKDNQTILAGGPGSGKTLLCFEALYRNAKNGIPGAFISFEEPPKRVLANAKAAFTKFDDIQSLVDSNMLVIGGEDPATKIQSGMGPEAYPFGNVVSDMEEVIKTNDAKYIAIDSLSLLKLMLGDNLLYRKSMIALISNLRRLGVTSLLTVEVPSAERKDLRFSPEFFIFDGLITLYQTGEQDKRSLTLEIVKMRGTDHSRSLAPYDITDEGFNVLTAD